MVVLLNIIFQFNMFDTIRLKNALEHKVTIKIDTTKNNNLNFILRAYYNFEGIFDWGDGTQTASTNFYSRIYHTYAEHGVYTITNWCTRNYTMLQGQQAEGVNILEIDFGQICLGINGLGFNGFSNLTKVNLTKIVDIRSFQTLLGGCTSFNQDISNWVYLVPYDMILNTWFSGKSYTDYDYQWIDNILNACYDREINGDGWGGLVKNLGLGNCRRSTASDVAFNYLKFVRGWTITLNATVIT